MESRDETNDSDRAAGNPRRDLVSASWLAGVPVVDGQGEAVGELAHVMLDVPRGTIAYAALACPRLIGSSDRLLGVPWTALVFDSAGQFFVLQLERDRLRGAPQRERAQWLLADPAFAAEMQAFYGEQGSARE